MNTGDLVTIGPLTGTVERMSIRSVGVRQDTGAYHIIPWSSITTFANFVRGIGSVVANYDVDRHEDLDKASQALKAAVDDLLPRRRSAVLSLANRRSPGWWAEQYRLYATRQLHYPAAGSSGRCVCPRHPGEKSTSIAPGFAPGTDLAAAADAGRRQPAAE